MENENKTLKICAVTCAVIGLLSLVMFIPAIGYFIIDLIGAEKGLSDESWYNGLLFGERMFFLIDFIALIVAYSDRVEKFKEKLKDVIFPKYMILKEYATIPDFKKWVGISALLYFIGILTIVRANFLYIDDLGRFAFGFKGWDNFSRYLSCFFSTFLHCDKHFLTDISPLTQIISVIFLAVASVIAVFVLSENRKVTFVGIVAAIPIGLSPYFLACLSFRYDSPYMALSILVSIFPLLFVPQQKNESATKQNLRDYIPYIVISIICILSMCMTYQAASGIYPMLVLILALKRWNKKEPFIIFLLTSISAFFVTIVIFKFFFVKKINVYVSTEIAGIRQLVPCVINNLSKYYSLIKSDYKELWFNLHIVNFILFIAVCTIHSFRKKTIAIVVNIICSVLLALFAFGIYPVLSKPLFYTRAMYGFGVLCGFISIMIVCQTKSIFAKLPSFALAWIFFVFAFTYGNALSEQKRYADFRVQQVVSDLNGLEVFANKNTKNVQISGIGMSPVLRNWSKNFKLLERTIPIYFGDGSFGDGWYWCSIYLHNYFSLQNINRFSPDLRKRDLPIIKDTMYHTIRGNGTDFLIELK